MMERMNEIVVASFHPKLALMKTKVSVLSQLNVLKNRLTQRTKMNLNDKLKIKFDLDAFSIFFRLNLLEETKHC